MAFIWVCLLALLLIAVSDVLDYRGPIVSDMPRVRWLFIVVLLPVVGAGLWFLLSRSDSVQENGVSEGE
ncbi:MAG: hypothetical protein C0482_12720 [Gordonia sp.]|nr:hypothetical protein [Gordonia sp. (in: high G+C Gram-positive bacteria)]